MCVVLPEAKPGKKLRSIYYQKERFAQMYLLKQMYILRINIGWFGMSKSNPQTEISYIIN